MMTLTGEHKIWLCTHDTDMRKSYAGLVAQVKTIMKQSPVTGDWFVFVNRRRTMMKVLYFAPGGYCIWSKRLEQGTFARFVNHKISMGEWLLLIEGLDIKQAKKRRRFEFKTTLNNRHYPL